MMGIFRNTPQETVPPAARPVLDLNGPILTKAFQSVVTGAEDQGGIERYVEAVKLKVSLFKDVLGDRGKSPERQDLVALIAFMPTVRRRAGEYLDGGRFDRMTDAIAGLLEGSEDTSTTDDRVDTFCRSFPDDRKHRWVRDLAAEILHFTDPERYPLMCRWIWDTRANTGVLREIWHGDNVDGRLIDIEDGYPTFLMLREELSGFLSENGVFRDVLYFVDLLLAQAYADYICAQGGSYLRADFASPNDPMEYVRRLLGLDGVKPGSLRTRLKSIDGEAFVIDEARLLNRDN